MATFAEKPGSSTEGQVGAEACVRIAPFATGPDIRAVRSSLVHSSGMATRPGADPDFPMNAVAPSLPVCAPCAPTQQSPAWRPHHRPSQLTQANTPEPDKSHPGFPPNVGWPSLRRLGRSTSFSSQCASAPVPASHSPSDQSSQLATQSGRKALCFRRGFHAGRKARQRTGGDRTAVEITLALVAAQGS